MRSQGLISAALVAVGLLNLACDKHDQGPGGHGHGEKEEEEPRSNAVTVWAERHELFIEYRLPVAGKPVKFIAHVTDMKEMQARTEGSVTFVFKLGSEPLEHTAPEVARPGIYLPEITFPRAGDWSWTMRIPQDGKDWTVELPAIKVYASQAEIDALPPEPEDDGGGISFLKEQQWKIPFRSLPVEKRDLVERVRISAEVSALPWARASVIAPAAGRLTPADGGSLPKPGEKVEAGQVVARIEPLLSGADLLAIEGQRYQLEAQSRELLVKMAEVESGEIQAKVRLEQAEKSLARVQKLVSDGAKSPRELEEADFALRGAKAELEAAAAVKKVYADTIERIGKGTSRDYSAGFPVIEVRAPISGQVTELSAVSGQHVEAGATLFGIVDLSQMSVRARLPEADLARVAPGMPAKAWMVQDRARVLDIGKAIRISPEVDPRTRTVGVEFAVENASGDLRSGLALTVLIETRRKEAAFAIPETAIVDEDGKPIAFVHSEGETCERRDLVLGIRDAGWVQVVSGLEEGERVVTIGAQAVRLSSMSSTIPAHGHAH
jgi:membrane fusion protein, heavy metal efflux system